MAGVRKLIVGSAAMMVLAGCGSSAVTSQGGLAAPSHSSAAPEVRQAEAFISQFTNGSDVTINTPLPRKPPSGKSVYWVQNDPAVEQFVTQGFAAATKALGWTLHTIVVDPSNPQQIDSAVQQSVSANADFIVVDTAPIAEFQQAYNAAVAKHIPIFQLFGDTPVGNKANDIYSQTGGTDQFLLFGKIIANYNIAKSNGQAHAVLFNVSAFTVFQPMINEEQKIYGQQCPACTLDVINLSLDQANAGIGSEVVSYLEQHPDVKYVQFAYGAMTTGVTQALKSAGLDTGLVITGSNPAEANLQEVLDGTQTMFVGLPLNLSAWYVTHLMAAYSEGVTLPPLQAKLLPTEILTKENIQTPIDAEGYRGPSGYENLFLKLWHVG
jgi:ribose transport system substrate-binding protein